MPAFARLREGYDTARARAAAAEGPLRLGFQCVVYEPVARAIAALPAGAVHLVELPWADPFSLLARGELDLAIVLGPCREPGFEVLLEFSRQTVYLAVAAGRGEAGAEPELIEPELIEPRGPAPAYWRLANAPRRTGAGRELRYPAGAATVQEGLSMVATTRLGLLLCEASVRYVQRPDIGYLPVPDLPPSSLLVVQREDRPHRLAAGFVEQLVRHAG
ncbi:LysR substrate-binding domain-containing protein [Streptomyces sp. Y1]|uniref:LysR substrate-binding domain-containing protein n=1 Tax=Streptomyces sp. Y1 TaxID=3238634 RepID=A0AB39TEF8_9ACTN